MEIPNYFLCNCCVWNGNVSKSMEWRWKQRRLFASWALGHMWMNVMLLFTYPGKSINEIIQSRGLNGKGRKKIEGKRKAQIITLLCLNDCLVNTNITEWGLLLSNFVHKSMPTQKALIVILQITENISWIYEIFFSERVSCRTMLF